MSTDATPSLDDAIREVTAEEVDAYHRNGWAKLEGLVRADVVAELLKRLKARMGEEADREVFGGYGVSTPRPPAAKLLFNSYEYPSQDDDYIRDFSLSVGMGRALAACAGGPVRSWGDNCYVKMPVSKAGGKTPWHQDWPYYPFDRAGSLTLWIALVDIPPMRGSMRFINGSHLWGPHGRVIARTDGITTYDLLPPYLRDRVEISPELHLKAGDATIHDDMTIHSAPPNTTEDARWVFTMAAFPADTLFTGCPQRRTDGLGLELNQPLDNPKFPVLPH